MSPRPTSSVEVYSVSVPDRPFVEIGIIEARGGRTAVVIERLRQRAGELGCDAVILRGEGDRVTGPWGTLVSRGACVVYRDAEPGETPETGPPPPAMARVAARQLDPRLDGVREKLRPLLPRARACFEGTADAPDAVRVKVLIRSSGRVRYLGYARPPVRYEVNECLRSVFESVGSVPNPGTDMTVEPTITLSHREPEPPAPADEDGGPPAPVVEPAEPSGQ